MQLPLIAVLLVAGIIVGVVFPGRLTDVFGAATLYVFLPALIFEGAWRLETPMMRRMWRPIALLAIPGVLCTAGIIAVCIHYLGGVSWVSALLLGAILSATDPVAVLAIFRRLQLPPLLTTIVESEALLNDAAAVVVYRAVLASAVAATAAALWHVAWDAVLGTVLGIGCGVVIAYLLALVLRRFPSPAAYAVLTMAGGYGSYFLANRYGWSGIFAVLVFAIALRLIQTRSLSAANAAFVGKFWEGIALVANAALFFLIGAALDLTQLGPAVPIALLTLAAVFLARFAIVYGLLHLARPRLHIAWMTVVRLAGIRGALSLALALAVPVAFADRELIVDATFVVVIVTLLVGSLTIARRLKSTVYESHPG
ncbi:MAG TPA: cation:proton antiporter [Candidatus Rubrimentiphilum sp.]|nr:cation:proton antiporter [Candidatus Rubrimentiphilum sp.]